MAERSVFERAKDGCTECTEEDFYYALGAVPPAKYLAHGFIMGEPYDFDRWYCFFHYDGRYWCKLTCKEDASGIIHIDETGITYNASKCFR